MAQGPESGGARVGSRRRAWIAGTSVVLGLALLIGALVAVVVWSQGRSEPTTARKVDTFSRYQSAWESAMDKAGVEATYPEGPVDLEQLRSTGRQPFAATFTPEEVAALLAVYRYRSDELGGDAELSNVRVDFPAENRASLSGSVTLNGQAYSAVIEAPVYYATGRLGLGRKDARLSVEGFSVGGNRRDQALQTLSDYLNAMLKAAPGLTVEKAEIIKGGVRIEGVAPSKLEHPDPVSPSGSSAYARTSNEA